MRVCDACYLGAGDQIVVVEGAKHHTVKAGSYQAPSVWSLSTELPEFCPDCFKLFQAKNWEDLGKRQSESMEKILKSKTRRRASDTPPRKPAVEDDDG